MADELDKTKLVGILLKNNATVGEIANVLGVNITTAQKYVNDYYKKSNPNEPVTEVEKQPKPKPQRRVKKPQIWTRAKELRLYEMLNADFTPLEIAEELDVPLSVVMAKAKALTPPPIPADEPKPTAEPEPEPKKPSRLKQAGDKVKSGAKKTGTAIGRGTAKVGRGVGRGVVGATKFTGRLTGNMALDVVDQGFGRIGQMLSAPLRRKLNSRSSFGRNYNPYESKDEIYVDGYSAGMKDAAVNHGATIDHAQLISRISKLSDAVAAGGAKIDNRLLQTLDIIKRVNFQDNTDYAKSQEKNGGGETGEDKSLFSRFFGSDVSTRTKAIAGVAGGVGLIGLLSYLNWDTWFGDNKSEMPATEIEPSDEAVIPDEEIKRVEEKEKAKQDEQAIRSDEKTDTPPANLKIEGNKLKYKADKITFETDELEFKYKEQLTRKTNDKPPPDKPPPVTPQNQTGGAQAAAGSGSPHSTPSTRADGMPNNGAPGGAGGVSNGEKSVGADPPIGDAAERLKRKYNPRRGENLPGVSDDPVSTAKRIMRDNMPSFADPAMAESAKSGGGMPQYDPQGNPTGVPMATPADPNAPASVADRWDAIKSNRGWDSKLTTGIDKAPDATKAGEQKPATSTTGTPSSQALAEERAKVMQHLDQNPALKEKLFAVAANEQGHNSKGVQAVMEETINRAITRGGSVEAGIRRLEKEIRFTSEGGYYDDRHGGQGRAWSSVRSGRKIYEEAFEGVRGGSNVSNNAYGNASGSVARNKITGASGVTATPTTKINGETFFGPNSDEPKYLKNYEERNRRLEQRTKEIEAERTKIEAEATAAEKVTKPTNSNMLPPITVEEDATAVQPPPTVPSEAIERSNESSKSLGKQTNNETDTTKEFASNDTTEKGVIDMQNTTYNDGFTSGKFPGLSGHDSPYSLLG